MRAGSLGGDDHHGGADGATEQFETGLHGLDHRSAGHGLGRLFHHRLVEMRVEGLAGLGRDALQAVGVEGLQQGLLRQLQPGHQTGRCALGVLGRSHQGAFQIVGDAQQVLGEALYGEGAGVVLLRLRTALQILHLGGDAQGAVLPFVTLGDHGVQRRQIV